MPIMRVLSMLSLLEELLESQLDFHMLISSEGDGGAGLVGVQIAMPTPNVGAIKKVADLLVGHQPRNYLIVYDGDHPVVYSLLRATSSSEAFGDRLFLETEPAVADAPSPQGLWHYESADPPPAESLNCSPAEFLNRPLPPQQ